MITEPHLDAAARALFGNDSLWNVASPAQKAPWLDKARACLTAAGHGRSIAALRKEAARLQESGRYGTADALALAADYLESLDEEDGDGGR